MPDLIGKTIGQYRIVGQIGLGGMATVFKAYQLECVWGVLDTAHS